MKFGIVARETGDLIEECATLKEAQIVLDAYERADMSEEIYEPYFYEIKEVA